MKNNFDKLNIGCGTNVIDGNGWLNIDNSAVAKLRRLPFWNFFIKLFIKYKLLEEFYLNYPTVKIVDIRKKLPFQDGSFKYIYCSQVVEHLHLYQLNEFILECHRILKPGGVMRILTPDLKKIVHLYNSSDYKTFELENSYSTKLISDHFNLFFYPRSWISEKKRGIVQRFLDSIPEHHKYIFDFESFKSLSANSMFAKVEEVETENSISFPNVHELDKYQDISLQVELTK